MLKINYTEMWIYLILLIFAILIDLIFLLSEIINTCSSDTFKNI